MVENKKNMSLVDQIIREPEKFDLMQSISLLEKEAVNNGFSPLGVNDSRSKSVRFSGKISLSFEASDLTMVKTASKKNYAYLIVKIVQEWTRTTNPEIFSLILYRLSYLNI